LKVVCDTGPLVAATDKSEAAHPLAAALVRELGRDLLIPDPVLVETDHLLRSRLGAHPARLFLHAVATGVHSTAFLSPGLLRRATDIDARFADLDLGFVDASVMAYAERHDLPILTFDFEDFRAAPPSHGHWRLVIDEARYADAVQ
jgi:uncharacterized protein